MTAQAIPSFFLYGEPPQAVGDRFLHLEALDDRSRPNNWNIRPHAHGDLSHVFHIAHGRGTMTADSVAYAFEAPCLLLVPAGAVHGFSYEDDAAGSVLTLAQGYLHTLFGRDEAFGGIFAAPPVVPLTGSARRVLRDSIRRLERELSWTAPGHAAAVDALLVGVLVEILRQKQVTGPASTAPHGAQAGLVARFRELVEARYRVDTSVEAYAAALAVSPKQLRAACLKIALRSPIGVIHDRLALEAKRLLLYSNMTVAEAGYHLGFSDPAYFSRFFAKAVGQSPRAFRSAPVSAEA